MHELSAGDHALLRELQRGVPVAVRPFDDIGRRIGLSESAVIERIRALSAMGIIRKMGAFVNHRTLGYGANGMAVWDVPEEKLGAVARKLCESESISHCYSRTCTPEWPYRLYTMIHGHSREEVLELARRFATREAIGRYEVLFSTRELKKAPWILPQEGNHDEQ